MMGRFSRMAIFGRAKPHDHQVVQHSIQQMGLEALAHRPIADLSGGQQQRVFLARALAQEPHILLMDEPFAGVDVSTQETTLGLLDELQQRQVTVMVSTHDLGMASTRFDYVVLLNHRLVAFGPAAEALTTETIREAFGGQVLFLENGAIAIDQCCHQSEEQEL